MIPPLIEEAIAKVQGTILECKPVCDGSRHYIVTFTAPAGLSGVNGAVSFSRHEEDQYRIHFILAEK